MGVLDRLILRDDQWERISRHIIGDDRTHGTSGRDNRLFLEAVLWIVRTDSPWRDLPVRIPDRRFHDRPRPPARFGRQKRGAEDQALGRSRGGRSTKIHMAVRGLGCPVRFLLTAGQRGDAPQGENLIEGLPADFVLAETAYDSDRLRDTIAAKGAVAVIPNTPSRALKYPLDEHLYAQRQLVECCFYNRLEQIRRVATRFEKTARNYSAVVTLAAIVPWTR